MKSKHLPHIFTKSYVHLSSIPYVQQFEVMLENIDDLIFLKFQDNNQTNNNSRENKSKPRVKLFPHNDTRSLDRDMSAFVLVKTITPCPHMIGIKFNGKEFPQANTQC